MGFLPNYEDDIFISYAHNDNQALHEGQRGWIDSFHQALEKRLQVHLGAKAKIWRDPRLQGNDYFAETLVEQIPRVAILVSVLSPSYINSEWCRREMELFCRVASDTGGVRLGNRARIFKVEKINVPLGKHPAELQGMTGYAFYYIDEKANRARELSPESGPHAIEYWQKIDDVAQDLTSLLEEMKGGAAGQLGRSRVRQLSHPIRLKPFILRRRLPILLLNTTALSGNCKSGDISCYPIVRCH